MKKELFDCLNKDWIFHNAMVFDFAKKAKKDDSVAGSHLDYGLMVSVAFRVRFLQQCLKYEKESDLDFIDMLENEMQIRADRIKELKKRSWGENDLQEHSRLQLEYTQISAIYDSCIALLDNKPFMLYCLNGSNDFEIKIFDKEPSDKEVFEYVGIEGSIDDKWEFCANDSDFRLESVSNRTGYAVFVWLDCGEWFLLGTYKEKPHDTLIISQIDDQQWVDFEIVKY